MTTDLARPSPACLALGIKIVEVQLATLHPEPGSLLLVGVEDGMPPDRQNTIKNTIQAAVGERVNVLVYELPEIGAVEVITPALRALDEAGRPCGD